MTAISNNVYLDLLNYIGDEYNSTYHRTIKMKPIDVGDDSVAQYNKEFNEKGRKFEIGDHVRISKYNNIFAKEYTHNWSEEILLIVISDICN